jgi:hypothetical protein
MKERRCHKRYSLDSKNIQGEIPDADSVKILNISLSGALLETDKRLDTGNRYILKLECEYSTLVFEGLIMRLTLDKNIKDSKGNLIPIYTAGILFRDLSNEEIIGLAKFIKDHVLDDKQRETTSAYLYKRDDR